MKPTKTQRRKRRKDLGINRHKKIKDYSSKTTEQNFNSLMRIYGGANGIK